MTPSATSSSKVVRACRSDMLSMVRRRGFGGLALIWVRLFRCCKREVQSRCNMYVLRLSLGSTFCSLAALPVCSRSVEILPIDLQLSLDERCELK